MPKRLAAFLILILTRSALAGESALTTTYQPLDGLGSGTIHIVQVTCHDGYPQSGRATAVGLISASNVPPTNNPGGAKADLNLASVCGIRFEVSGADGPKAAPELTLDMTRFAVPQSFGHAREEVIRASLECLRRCLPEALRKTPVTLRGGESEKQWIKGIIADFNAHDRTTPFFTSSK